MESGSDQGKKVNLEDLSKDELIKRCKNLLLIAQKAKSAKDAVIDEVNTLKDYISKTKGASEVMIDNLTQQKLGLVTTVEELKSKNATLEKQNQECLERLNQLENETISSKRQNNRLTEENEQLISDLEILEQQIDELKKLGLQQQSQLLELEKNKKPNEDVAKVNELQSMLSISLEEVKKLQAENKSAWEKVEDLKINLKEKDNNILAISKELQLKCDKIQCLNNELKSINTNKLETCNERLNQDEHQLDPNTIVTGVPENSNLININEKLKEKLKLYHSKLIKFAGQIKALKSDKKEILELFMSYTHQVKDWKDQLNIVARELPQLEVNFKIAKEQLQQENTDLKNNLSTIKEEMLECTKQLDILKNENDESIKKSKDLEQLLQDAKAEVNKLQFEHKNGETLFMEKQDLESKLSSILKDKDMDSNKIIEYQSMLEESNKKLNDFLAEKERCERELLEANQKLSKLELQLERSKTTETQLAEKSSEEILKLVQETKDLKNVNTSMQEELENLTTNKRQTIDIETQVEEDLVSTNELEEQISIFKRENGELLREMNEMNQVLKERGESISKLESHYDEVLKKLQTYEAQANSNDNNMLEKDQIIKKLNDEIESLRKFGENVLNDDKESEIMALKNEIELLKERMRENLDVSYADSETMSTSTISRMDEVNRLKDLDGSWEERYGKLRNLALKLKQKIKEQSIMLAKELSEKEELQKTLSQNIKITQTLQAQCDKLEDELEISKKELKQYSTRLNTIAEDISKDKQQLAKNDSIISGLKQELEVSKNDKQATENWKKQVSIKIQTLRKELEANKVLKKEFELNISKLTADLEAKDQQLKNEIDDHKQTKNLLDQSNSECKKNSVLNLEMQDFEKSVKELSQKLENKQEHINKLKNQIDSYKNTISALKKQNKVLEEKIENEESTLTTASTKITSYKKNITDLENSLKQKEEKILSLTGLLESSRSEAEELSTELSKVIADHQKAVSNLKTEKDYSRSQIFGMQQTLREAQDLLALKEDELRIVSNEYENYKVRAQSVLRHNQNRDVGLEEKLNEEVFTLKSQNNLLNIELKELLEKSKGHEKSCENLEVEKEGYLRKCQQLESEMDELKTQFTQLSNVHKKTLIEHAESVRNLKIHAETLSQCYRQQQSEQESRHNREMIELQSKIDNAPPIQETPQLLLPTMPREEGEGSESIENNNINNSVNHLVPLEQLLSTDRDLELPKMKKTLTDLESKVVYLTALLSDTEQDLAKHVQMNKMLKEEIRRQQRSVEREKHADNLEYLKNVVFKFVTLNSGDERTRLVPVLNTILKLSPEETNKLSQVAKGDPGIKGWTNYLPAWSSKPQ